MRTNKTDPLTSWKNKFDQLILAPWSPFKSTLKDLNDILNEASDYVSTLNPNDQKQLKLTIEIINLATICFDETLNHFPTECSGETIITPPPQNLEQSLLVLEKMQIVILKLLYPYASSNENLAKNKVEINENTFTVTFDGHSCHLGNKNIFKILQHLNKHIATNVPVKELKTAVWGQLRIQDNTLQKTISDLRNKLKEDGVKITIQSNIKGHYSLTLNEVS
jgi:hypothetical protein